ncbi:hypothetical protein BV20DRAFT_968493 [Pilatotrama ljubarskyi]|nr:hypothetical protein BV20DRAFT_968493 [Pilatotrama ljubarskyi]
MPTNFLVDPIALETDINHSQVSSNGLLEAWEHLAPFSIETTLAGHPSLYEFGDAHCLFFAAILWDHKVPPAATHDMANPPLGSNPPLSGSSAANYQIQVPSQEAARRWANTMREADGDDGEGDDVKPVRVWDTVGITYITSSPIPNEVHIGVGVLPKFRGKGLGKTACELALQWAFDTLQIHRVQARIMTSAHQHRARSLFASLGFSHEGVHRRSVMNTAGEWVDVAHMGMLDTDWSIHTRLKSRAKSLWDEVLERHQRELDELVLLEERQKTLRRTSSMETVRVVQDPNPARDARNICSPTPPSITLSSGCSRASSTEPIDQSDESDESDAEGSDRFAHTSPRSPVRSEAGESVATDHEWVMGSAMSDVSFSSGEHISRPPSSASFSSEDSVSFVSAPSAPEVEPKKEL